jgi:hypothetical protein
MLCRAARFKSWLVHNRITTFLNLRYALWEEGQGFSAISHRLEAELAIISHIGWTGSWIGKFVVLVIRVVLLSGLNKWRKWSSYLRALFDHEVRTLRVFRNSLVFFTALSLIHDKWLVIK